MHVGIAPSDMDPQLWGRLKDSDTVIIETDLDQMSPSLLKRYLFLPAGESLRQKLGATYWTKYIALLRSYHANTPEAEVDRLTPMAAGTKLLQAQTQEGGDDPARESIDQVIFETARTEQKTTRTFETPEEQLHMLSEVFTLDELKSVIDETSSETDEYKKLKDAFKNGDSATLDEMLKEFPENLRQKMLDERNQNWVRLLPKLKGRHHTLIAVGAAHFAGPHGLLVLLKEAGYKIREKN